MELNFNLHKKQGVAFKSTATEILYGGAAGGGKSHLMRIALIVWCLEIKNLQCYLFRRIRDDLISTHMEGPTGFRQLLAKLVNGGKATIVDDEVRFFNGSKIYLCHCKDEKDKFKYDGAEMHVLAIDELTHFTESIYRYLRSRVRMTSIALPEKYIGVFPRVLTGSNPGKVGHAWVKRTFIDYQPPYEIKKTDKEEGGMQRQFIPALLEDNPSLDKEDYEGKLYGLGSPDLVKAMRFGLWDITAGAALEKLSRERHMLRTFRPLDYWTKFTCMDWGSSKPFSVGWYCIPDEDFELIAKGHHPARIIPKNSLIRYREYYGWNGKPNEGCRMESPDVAKRILEIEEDAEEDMDYRVGDSSMWSKVDGPSVEERMSDATDNQFIMEKSIKDRENNYQEIRARLEGEDGYPMLYVTENCKHFWRTVPDLQLDELHPEKGPDSEQEDHPYDDVSYACASRPLSITLKQRQKDSFERAKNALKPVRKKARGY